MQTSVRKRVNVGGQRRDMHFQTRDVVPIGVGVLIGDEGLLFLEKLLALSRETRMFCVTIGPRQRAGHGRKIGTGLSALSASVFVRRKGRWRHGDGAAGDGDRRSDGRRASNACRCHRARLHAIAAAG